MRSLQISDKGDRLWNRLAELGWTRRSTFPASRGERRRGAGSAQEAAAQGDGEIFREACPDRDRDRSLQCEQSLGTTAAIIRSYGEVDRAATGQTVRQARQERCGGC